MSRPAITVENLSKAYRIGLKEEISDTFVTAAAGWLRRPLTNLKRLHRLSTFGSNGNSDDPDTFWALRDVSFEVPEGKVVGIIGRNGAGKSTLLKILSRITEPTSGRALIHGRVSSLLEVGTGFHPELSGRENIYMNGTILGMRKREIDRKFDEIVAFSGVERFLDTPIKRYSSGMTVRLAFAVAAHLEPEILIIDEVLAVGDAEFQRKCMGKMQDVARAGRTVLFVSHNMPSIVRLCSRVVLIAGGAIEADGDPLEIVDRYQALKRDHEEAELLLPDTFDKPVQFLAIRTKNVKGQTVSLLNADDDIFIEFEFIVRQSCHVQIAFRLLNRADGTVVLTSSLSDYEHERDRGISPGTYRTNCTIPASLLRPGSYGFLVAANNGKGGQFDLVPDALNFTVSNVNSLINLDHRLGVIAPLLHWNITGHSLAEQHAD